MLKFLKSSLVFGLLFSNVAAQAELPPYYKVVLLTDNYPPFNMAVDDKNFARDAGIDGFAAEIVRETFKRAGIGYTLSLRFPWDRLYKLTLKKPNYGLFSTTRTPEREPLFKWVGPLGQMSWVLVSAQDKAITLKSLDDVKQYKVGAFKNSAVTQWLEVQNIPMVAALRDQENPRKLIKGQIELWATDDPAWRYMVRQEDITGLRVAMRMNEAEVYLALNKETPDEVVHRLQKALDELRAEGFVDEMTNNYL